MVIRQENSELDVDSSHEIIVDGQFILNINDDHNPSSLAVANKAEEPTIILIPTVFWDVAVLVHPYTWRYS